MKERYHRQVLLPEIGEEGQKKLQSARVLIVGMGGLGCPIALYLCGAGIGTLGLMDDDIVSISNLHRQVIYDEADIGQPKALCATRHLRAKNNDIRLIAHPMRLTKENADALIRDYDIVVDGCDNPSTRYLMSDACHRQGKPYVYVPSELFKGKQASFVTSKRRPLIARFFPTRKLCVRSKPRKE